MRWSEWKSWAHPLFADPVAIQSNPRFIEEHEKPFHLPWFTKIMILIAVLGFLTVGTLLLTAFFSGHLGMMSVTRGGTIFSCAHFLLLGCVRVLVSGASREFAWRRAMPCRRVTPQSPLVQTWQK